MRIIHKYPRSNPPPTGIRILFFHIRQYLYPYPKVKCGYRYDKSNIRFVSNSMSEDWVLDNDIHMEETILQLNEQ